MSLTQCGLALGGGGLAHRQGVGVDLPSVPLGLGGDFALGHLALHPLLVVFSSVGASCAVHHRHPSVYTSHQPLWKKQLKHNVVVFLHHPKLLHNTSQLVNNNKDEVERERIWVRKC